MQILPSFGSSLFCSLLQPKATSAFCHLLKSESVIQHKTMEIFVDTPTGHRIALHVHPTQTVLKIKKKLHKKMFHLLPKYQHIYKIECDDGEETGLAENELSDDITLVDYRILPNSVLRLESDMWINLTTLDGSVYTFPVEPFNTIRDLKVNFFQKTGILMDYQQLFYASKLRPDGSRTLKIPLEDSWTLKLCNFENDKDLLVEFPGWVREEKVADKTIVSHLPISYWVKVYAFAFCLTKLLGISQLSQNTPNFLKESNASTKALGAKHSLIALQQ